jgi:LuxR family maltose regulon positive regulatory protein
MELAGTEKVQKDRKVESKDHPRVAWLSLDERDNDTVSFWIYVIVALQTIAPEIGATTLSLLEPPPTSLPLSMPRIQHRVNQEYASEANAEKASELDRIQAVLTVLINEITSLQTDKDNHPLILVLDDYHVVEKESIHAGLSFFLEHLPPSSKGLHLIISGRTDPPLPLSRLRSRRELNELDLTDLRFTPDEASTFLNQVMKLDLSAKDVTELEARTEGWIVGLQMAAQFIMGRSPANMDSVRSTTADQQFFNPTELIRSFSGSHRDVVDYLTDEVLLQQPVEIQYFLLQTSILDRLCGQLCDAVCCLEDAFHPMKAEEQFAQDILEHLEAANLFIVPLDNERKWFRYHHLFSELLQQRLNRRYPDLAPALHLRASEWYVNEGLIDQAVFHAQAACDFEHAADLIRQHGGDAFSRGEFRQVLSWLEALPEKLVRSHPVLCVFYAYAALINQTNNLELSERWVHEAQTLLDAWSEEGTIQEITPDVYNTVHHNLITLRALIARARAEPHSKVIELIQNALEVIPESDQGLRSILVVQQAVEYLNSGDEQASERALVDAERLGERADFHYTVLVATYLRTLIARRHGRLRDVVNMCHESIETIIEPIEQSGRSMPIGGIIYIALGSVLVEWNDISGADRALIKGLESTKLLPMADAQFAGILAMARLRSAQRNFAWYPDLEILFKQHENWPQDFTDMFWSRFWLLQPPQESHYMELALRWAEEHKFETADWDWGIWEQLTRARIIIRQIQDSPTSRSKPDLYPVLVFLDAQYQIVESYGWSELMIDTLIVQALAFQSQGRKAVALKAVERALSLGESEGYTRIFLDEGLPMAHLLYGVAQRGKYPKYVGKLLAAIETIPIVETEGTHRRSSTKEQKAHPIPLIEPLTQREVEVLHLLAEGLSNRAIAQRLHISLSTVKRHNANIYGKLTVQNRTQAVARARDFGLL